MHNLGTYFLSRIEYFFLIFGSQKDKQHSNGSFLIVLPTKLKGKKYTGTTCVGDGALQWPEQFWIPGFMWPPKAHCQVSARTIRWLLPQGLREGVLTPRAQLSAHGSVQSPLIFALLGTHKIKISQFVYRNKLRGTPKIRISQHDPVESNLSVMNWSLLQYRNMAFWKRSQNSQETIGSYHFLPIKRKTVFTWCWKENLTLPPQRLSQVS